MTNGAQRNNEVYDLRDNFVTQNEFRPVVEKVSELSENYASLSIIVNNMDKNLTEINRNIKLLVDDKNYMRGIKKATYIFGMGIITLITLDYSHVLKNISKFFIN